ncbi:MAG: hypothetical protein HYT83_04080 [Candidatus Levybacteria bacterium]|nr:hypothetical protein [Candidatus Levybacteria bacterium]
MPNERSVIFMADDVHRHDHIIRESSDRTDGMGFLLGLIILAIFLFLLLFYGIPFLRNAIL